MNDTISTLKLKSSHYFIGGLSLVVALSWNSTIKNAINEYFPVPESNIKASFLYAFVLTFILILIIYALPDTLSEMPEKFQMKVQENNNNQMLNKINYLNKKIEYMSGS